MRKTIAILVATALAVGACGDVEPSRPAASVVAPQPSVANASTAPSPDPSPTSTPIATPTATPTPPAQTQILASGARSGSDAIVVRGSISAEGVPVSGAPIRITALPLDGPPQTIQLTGTVPPDAKTAFIGIGVNMEGVGPHKANLRIYGAGYTEGTSTKNRVRNPRLRANVNWWGLHEDGITIRRSDIGPGLMIRIIDKPSQSTLVQTTAPATQGKRFRATMLVRVPESSVGSAIFRVVWWNEVTEIARMGRLLEPVTLRLPERRSTSVGRFKGVFSGLTAGRYRVTVSFAGDATHQPSTWTTVIRVR